MLVGLTIMLIATIMLLVCLAAAVFNFTLKGTFQLYVIYNIYIVISGCSSTIQVLIDWHGYSLRRWICNRAGIYPLVFCHGAFQPGLNQRKADACIIYDILLKRSDFTKR